MNIEHQATPAIRVMAPAAPVLEARHLRKDFPLRSANPFGKKRAVQAVEALSATTGIAQIMSDEDDEQTPRRE